VLILKAVKVLRFEPVSQVLIAKGIRAREKWQAGEKELAQGYTTPAIRMVIKTRGLLNLMVVSD
jgi:hypothetical protein